MPVPAETPEDYTEASGVDVGNIRQTNWAPMDTQTMLPGKMLSNGELQPTATPVLMVPAENF